MEKDKENSNKEEMKKKRSGVFLIFVVITTFVFFIFPEKLLGNIYVLIAYLMGCLFLIFKFYRYKE